MARRSPRFLIALGLLSASALLTHGSYVQADPPPEAKATTASNPSGPKDIRAWDDVAFAGLPPGSRPEALTWERAYTLAVVRYRAGDRSLAVSLDPKRLAADAERLGVADFERFRNDFRTPRKGRPNDGATFVDPSASLFDLLSRLQRLENARKFVIDLEQFKAVSERLLAEMPNPPRLHLLDRWMEKARRGFLDEVRTYRDQLGAMKAELGLSPRAPIVPDSTRLERFRAVFAKVTAWFARPERTPAELTAILAGLPPLEDVRVDTLLKIRTAYQDCAQQLSVSILAKDQAFRLAMATPPPGTVVKVPNLFALHDQILTVENRLVALWASFHTERMAVARDQGVPPGRDWKSFLAQIQGEPGG